MIRLRFAGTPGLRFAFSPIWEVLAAARAQRSRNGLVWSEEQLQAADRALEGCRMEALWDAVDPSAGYIPPFLAPAPRGSVSDLDHDLHRVRATPASRVRSDLARLLEIRTEPTPRLKGWADRPGEYREAVSGAIRTYWDRVLKPRWGPHREVLEGEVLNRGRQLAMKGREAVLGSLHEAIAWNEGTLEVDCTALDRTDSGIQELVLVPSVYTWPKTFVAGADPGLRVVYYPARGAGTLLFQGEGAPSGLAELMGDTRAQILHHLRAPSTTSELAGRLSLAPATVSEHLGVLKATGLADRGRVGRRVYYRVSTRGARLLRLFE